MRLSDTIIGAIIIGVLVGGAILYVGQQDRVKGVSEAQTLESSEFLGDARDEEAIKLEFKVSSEEFAKKIKEADLNEQVQNALGNIDVGSEIEGALLEALQSVPELSIKLEIETQESKEDS